MPFNAMILKPSFFFLTMKLEKEILNNRNPNKKTQDKSRAVWIEPHSSPTAYPHPWW